VPVASPAAVRSSLTHIALVRGAFLDFLKEAGQLRTVGTGRRPGSRATATRKRALRHDVRRIRRPEKVPVCSCLGTNLLLKGIADRARKCGQLIATPPLIKAMAH